VAITMKKRKGKLEKKVTIENKKRQQNGEKYEN